MTTETISLAMPEQSALIAEADDAKSTADFLVVTDEESLKIAKDEMNAMTKRMKALDAKRKEITKPLDDAKKAVMNLFKPPIDTYQGAINVIKFGIARYVEDQERIAAEARMRAEAEAAAARAALEAKAREAETPQEAEVIKEAAALVVPAAVTAKPAAKVSGMSTQKVWRGRVVDMGAFLAHVAIHPECFDLIEVKQGALDRFIRATGGAVAIPGVETHQETIVSSRS